MIGLDLLGAAAPSAVGAGEALATQVVQVRIKSIDPDKLRRSINAGYAGVALGPALAVVDQFPKMAIDMALPVIRDQLQNLGITAEVSVTGAPGAPRQPSEVPAAVAVGAALGASLALVGRWVYYRFLRKGVRQ